MQTSRLSPSKVLTPSQQASETMKIAIVCSMKRTFDDIQKSLLYADTKLRRYVDFNVITEMNDLRGRRFDAYVLMHDMNARSIGKSEKQRVITFFATRGVEELTIDYTDKGPLLLRSNGKQLLG